MNLKPEFWGPYAWMFLYTIALGYPNTPTEDDRESVKQLFGSFGSLLPCERCRHNFDAKMAGPLGGELEGATSCSETLVKFVYDLESAVAVTNGKTPAPMDTVISKVLSNQYVVPPRGAVASSDVVAGGDGGSSSSSSSSSPLLWALLPVGIVLASVVTWVVTYKVLKKRGGGDGLRGGVWSSM